MAVFEIRHIPASSKAAEDDIGFAMDKIEARKWRQSCWLVILEADKADVTLAELRRDLFKDGLRMNEVFLSDLTEQRQLEDEDFARLRAHAREKPVN